MKRTSLIFLSVVLLGAGCAFGHPVNTEGGDENVQINEAAGSSDMTDPEDVQTDSDDIAAEPDPIKLDMLPFHSKLCTDVPVITEIGSGLYPIDAKYGDLYFLGQLFTAARCGEGRVHELWGIRDGMYVIGSTISLKEPPDEEMTSVLRWIGFTCDEGIGDGVCTRWELTDEVPYENLLYLEPFHDRIEADDCRNCG